MKKKYVIIGGAIVATIVALGVKKSLCSSNKEKKQVTVKETIKMETLAAEDHIESFQRRRDLFLVAYCKHLQEKGNTEGVKELLRLCSGDVKKLTEEVDRIEDDPEAGSKHSRLYILLGKSRTAYLEKSLGIEDHELEILNQIEIMNKIDAAVVKYGLV